MSEVRKNAVWMLRAAAAAIGVTAVQPAAAQIYGPIDAYYPDPDIGKPSKAVLTIPVKASVGGQCGFATAPNATRNVGQIDVNPWNEVVNFVPECTAPWRIAITSQNGGLQHTTAGAQPAGYAAKATYTIALSINNDGTPNPLTRSCDVTQVYGSGSGCDFNGTASTTNGLLVPRSYGLAESNITLSAPAYVGPGVLISGTYQDTLVVTVSPAT